MDGADTSPGLNPRWWRAGPRIPSLALFGVVAFGLLASMALIFGTIRAERGERAQVRKTSEILLALSDIETAAVNAETGQRGFFITADRRYLAPYRLALKNYPVAMEQLTTLLGPSASSRQLELLAEIQRLGDAKFAEMEDTIAQVDGGAMVEAKDRILSDEGQLTMDQLRGTLGELAVIERAALARATADSRAQEGRIVPLLVGLLLFMIAALALGLWQVIRTARAEAAASQAVALADARDRADLLARELNHRVKNLFAVILAIVRMSGKDAPEAKPVIDKISKRIHALVTAHDVTQGTLERPVVDLEELIQTAIAPYRSDSEPCEIEGPPVTLSAKMAVPLGLVLHELVTNMVKYGAWAKPGGLLSVKWHLAGSQPPRVALVWCEDGAKIAPETGREGFGSLLIRSSAGQLGGTIEREFHDDGIRVSMNFPIDSAPER